MICLSPTSPPKIRNDGEAVTPPPFLNPHTSKGSGESMGNRKATQTKSKRHKNNRGLHRATPEDFAEEFPIGKTIERWTVAGPAVRDHKQRKWKIPCRCQCGTQKLVQVCALRPTPTRGGRVASKSCGCHNIDVRRNRLPVGYRSGRLEVIEWVRQSVRPSGRPGDSIYLCQCDCGNTCEVASKHLHTPKGKAPTTQSCGCYAKEQTSIRTSKQVQDGSHANAKFAFLINGELIHKMRSTWELAVAYALHEQGVDFLYEPNTFVVGPSMRYTPDFYLTASQEYIEVKGFWRPNAKKKVKAFQEKHVLHVVDKNTLEKWTGLTPWKAAQKYKDCRVKDI